MKNQKDITNEIIDEAMGQILSGVRKQSVLNLLIAKYTNRRTQELRSLMDIANEDAMNYMNDMENLSNE